MNCFTYEMAIGPVCMAEDSGSLVRIIFGKDFPSGDRVVRETPLLAEAARQIGLYLSGSLTVFSLPVAPCGTAFMLKVWKELCRIPYGATASYSDIAVAIGNPRAVRAVGQANNRNPLPIVIPCHRVIGKDGSLTGYAGGLEIKRRLLALEAGVRL